MLLVTAATVVLALVPQAVQADFGKPRDVTPNGVDSRSPRVAINAAGDVLVAWWYYDGADYRTRVSYRPADGSRARTATISPAGLDSFPNDVALTDAGVGYVVMESAEPFSGQAVLARTVTAAGFGPLRTVAPASVSANYAYVDVDAAGTARLFWEDSYGDQIATRTMTPTSVLGPKVVVTPAATNLVLDSFASPIPHATAANGQTVVAWRMYQDNQFFIQARMIRADGTLGPVRTMSKATGPAREANVCIDADGDAVVTWEFYDNDAYRVQAATLSKDSVRGTTARVSTRSEVDIDETNVASDGNGGAMVVYESFVSVNRLRARRLLANGTLGPALWVTPSTYNASFPYVVTTGPGQYTLVWTSNPGGIRIQGRTLTLGGTLGKLRSLSPKGRIVAAHTAAGAPGHAVAAWVVEPPGSTYRVQVATSP